MAREDRYPKGRCTGEISWSCRSSPSSLCGTAEGARNRCADTQRRVGEGAIDLNGLGCCDMGVGRENEGGGLCAVR